MTNKKFAELLPTLLNVDYRTSKLILSVLGATYKQEIRFEQEHDLCHERNRREDEEV